MLKLTYALHKLRAKHATQREQSQMAGTAHPTRLVNITIINLFVRGRPKKCTGHL